MVISSVLTINTGGIKNLKNRLHEQSERGVTNE